MAIQSDNANQAQERRRYRRFPAAELSAKLRVKKGLFSDWVDVSAKDFSSKGIAIETEATLEHQQSITLQVILKVDMGDILVDKVEAIVRNSAKQFTLSRYGVEFDFEANRHMKSPEIKKQLEKIESMLERSASLRQRMEEQQNN